MKRAPNDMVATWSEPAAAPQHAISLNPREFDRLVEAAGVLVGRDQSAVNAQPHVEFFRERLATSRALLAALHKHQWGRKRTPEGSPGEHESTT